MFTTVIGWVNLILIILLSAITPAATSNHQSYLLSCGAPITVSNTNSSFDDRTWYSDNNSTFSNSLSTTADATTNAITNVPLIPFSTARIFSSKFIYSFPVSPGPKFIRLYFYPSTAPYHSSSFPPLSSNDAYLTVESNSGHILLYNFSAFLSIDSSKQKFIQKEFYVNVTNSPLQITLSPTPGSSFAFVNGIEVVSDLDKLYVNALLPLKFVSSSMNSQFSLPATTALETLYRVSVGGNEVNSVEDAGDMYRRWETDDTYLSDEFMGLTGLDSQTDIRYTASTPNYSAPNTVYRIFRSMGLFSNEIKLKSNLTWNFEVDLGFSYLLRLHWCEVVIDVTSSNNRVFDVYIDEQMADEGMDIFYGVGGFTAAHKDYVYYLDGGVANGGDIRGVLKLAMNPNTDYNHE